MDDMDVGLFTQMFVHHNRVSFTYMKGRGKYRPQSQAFTEAPSLIPVVWETSSHLGYVVLYSI